VSASLRESWKLILNPGWKELRKMNARGFDETDPENLKSVIYYDELPEHFTRRAKKLFPVVKKLSPGLSFKDWINGFKYDLYPEREMAKWEDQVNHYLDKTGRKTVSPAIKQATWDRILNKMSQENYLKDVLKGNGIESGENEENIWRRR